MKLTRLGQRRDSFLVTLNINRNKYLRMVDMIITCKCSLFNPGSINMIRSWQIHRFLKTFLIGLIDHILFILFTKFAPKKEIFIPYLHFLKLHTFVASVVHFS